MNFVKNYELIHYLCPIKGNLFKISCLKCVSTRFRKQQIQSTVSFLCYPFTIYSYLCVLYTKSMPLATKTTSPVRHLYFIVLYVRKWPSSILQFALEEDEALPFLFYVLLIIVFWWSWNFHYQVQKKYSQ